MSGRKGGDPFAGLTLAEAADGVFLSVWLKPNAKHERLLGVREDGSLLVSVAAPAIEGRANQRLCKFLANVLSLPVSAVTLAAGGRSRRKRLHIQGVTAHDVGLRLRRFVDGQS